jgi:thiamine-monophosphate kinase
VCTLAGGDDYELLFTAPADRTDAVHRAAAQAGVSVTAIGRIASGGGLTVRDAQGQVLDAAQWRGFDHFESA